MDNLAQTNDVRLTSDAFIVWAVARTEGRYELADGLIVTMVAKRARHNLAKAAVRRCLEDALRAAGQTNTVFADGMLPVINREVAREPDAIVCVGSKHDPDLIEVRDPLIVVEVLSPSTAATDLGVKVTEFLSIASVEHYLSVDPASATILHHRRGRASQQYTSADTIKVMPPGLVIAARRMPG